MSVRWPPPEFYKPQVKINVPTEDYTVERMCTVVTCLDTFDGSDKELLRYLKTRAAHQIAQELVDGGYVELGGVDHDIRGGRTKVAFQVRALKRKQV